MSEAPRGRDAALATEIEAARRRAALFDYSARGKLSVVGSDRICFLQGMLTSDVASLAEGRAHRSALVTAKGKMISSLLLLRDRDRILIETPPGRVAALIETLDKLLITEDVELTDLTSTWGIVSVQGPLSTRVLRETLDIATTLPESNFAFELLDEPEGSGLLLRHERYREIGYDLWLPAPAAEAVARRILEGAATHGVVRGGAEARDVLRIAAGRPAWGREIDGERFPGEVGLSSAVSITKGCYVGQEVLSRIHHLGHVNRQLARVEVDGHAELAVPVPLFHDDKRIGELTSLGRIPGEPQRPGLAVIRTEVAREGQSLTARPDGGAAVAVRVRDVIP